MDHGFGPISDRAGTRLPGSAAAYATLDAMWAADIESLLEARRAFERTLSGWVGDLLDQRACFAPGDPHAQDRMLERQEREQALADHQDRDWHRLYQGSVLDD